jgi:hypothetical protein
MERETVIRFALVLSVQAEVEGMKAENEVRKSQGLSPTYGESQFSDMANKLSNLAYCHDQQLG